MLTERCHTKSDRIRYSIPIVGVTLTVIVIVAVPVSSIVLSKILMGLRVDLDLITITITMVSSDEEARQAVTVNGEAPPSTARATAVWLFKYKL